jgi:hypothetical protein
MKTFRDYETILRSIQRIAPEAHIGGGAVRDTIIGKPIRDVDVFIGPDRKDHVAAMLRAEFKYVKVGEWEQYELFSDKIIDRVAKFEHADETIPIAVIALKEPLAVRANLARFDFGVCMCGWDGDEVIETPAFRHDLEKKVFTLHRADHEAQFSYSMRRYERLTAERYAGWDLAIPETFKQFLLDDEFKRHWWVDEHNLEFSRLGVELSHNLLRPKHRPQPHQPQQQA